MDNQGIHWEKPGQGMLELQTHLCDNIKTQTMKRKVAFVIKRSDSVSLTHPNMLNPEKIMLLSSFKRSIEKVTVNTCRLPINVF